MTHTFSINNRNFLAVPVPDGSNSHMLGLHKDILLFYKGEWDQISLPPGQWKLIGLYPGMSEEQAAGIVEMFTDQSGYYQDYERPKYGYELAVQSFASKMSAEKIYLVNPHGEQPKRLDFEIQPGSKIYDNTLYINALNDWQAAELRKSKVFVIIQRLNK